jgi:hypothetical protein
MFASLQEPHAPTDTLGHTQTQGEEAGEGGFSAQHVSATIVSHLFWPKLGGWGDEADKVSAGMMMALSGMKLTR